MFAITDFRVLDVSNVECRLFDFTVSAFQISDFQQLGGTIFDV